MFEVKARSGAATPSDLGGMSAAGAQLGWGAWGKCPLLGNCSAGCGHNPLGKKRGILAAAEEIVALACKMEAFGVGDGQPGSTVSKSSSVGCVVPAQRQAGTAGGDAGCRL